MRVLYGLFTTSRFFHQFLEDFLRRIGFTASRADLDLWYRKSDDYHGYEYIVTHINDFLIAAKDPSKYMAFLEQEFYVRNIEDSPSYYRGCNITLVKGKWHVSTKK